MLEGLPPAAPVAPAAPASSTAHAAPVVERPDALTLLMNYLPLAHLASGAALVATLPLDGPVPRVALALAWLYLLPPLVVRLTLALAGRPAPGAITLGEPAYRLWWWLTQWQLLFNRLPWLEELLRLVPGLYAGWIWLWGGRMSPLCFVGPGVVITDRHAVRVERFAVLGMRSGLAGHVVQLDEAGRYRILIGEPVVERQALLGGEAGLGPGAVLRAGQMLPFGRRLGPFAVWPREGVLPVPAAPASPTPSAPSAPPPLATSNQELHP